MSRKLWAVFRSMLLIFMFIIFPIELFAAAGFITGKILDSETNEPLPGANIVILGTLYGASADLNGYFFIQRVPPGRYSIRVSMIGYRSITKKDVSVTNDQ